MILNLSVGISNSSSLLRSNRSRTTTVTSLSKSSFNFAPALLAAALIFTSSPLDSSETFSNVPQTLSGNDKKQARIQKPRSRKAESCTTRCVGTCIRGGAGSPGEGPLNVRRPLVVFKQGFRSRQYCLVECSDICNLIKEEDYDWP